MAEALDAHAFVKALFEMTSREVILKHSSVRKDGYRVLFLPTIAHLIRASYYLKQGEDLSGIEAFTTKTTLTINLTGNIQSWASRNCGRCDPCKDTRPFQRVGKLERAISVELEIGYMKKCLQGYLGAQCVKMHLGPVTIERFFAHINGDLSMHSDTSKRVYKEIGDMRASLR